VLARAVFVAPVTKARSFRVSRSAAAFDTFAETEREAWREALTPPTVYQ